MIEANIFGNFLTLLHHFFIFFVSALSERFQNLVTLVLDRAQATDSGSVDGGCDATQ